MTGYTGLTMSLKTVTVCLIKVQTYYESICGKVIWLDG